MNLVDGSSAVTGASDMSAAVGTSSVWPFAIARERKDELQLVLEGLRRGRLSLSVYLLEMFERAGMYFHQIGGQHYPAARVQQIQSLHDLAQKVHPPLMISQSCSVLLTICTTTFAAL